MSRFNSDDPVEPEKLYIGQHVRVKTTLKARQQSGIYHITRNMLRYKGQVFIVDHIFMETFELHAREQYCSLSNGEHSELNGYGWASKWLEPVEENQE